MEAVREKPEQKRDLRARTWKPRPVLSLVAGALLLFGPIAMAWFVVRIVGGHFYQPQGLSGLLIWVAQAVVVSSAVTILIHRLAERLSPLTVLLKLTLVFPDHAPSRFATALRIGNMNRVVREAAPLSGSLNDAAVRAVELVVALTHHDRRTRGHTERVRAYGEMIAEEMGIEGEELNSFRWGLLLHDIGKLAVPDEILNKSEELTNEEWQILRKHPAAGATMVEPLRVWLGEHVDAAGQHHEKWDGTGYPNNLAGTEISLIGRVCSIADAYDVITSRRSYKAPMSAAHARSELVEGAGTHFDPVVVRTFLRLGLRRKPALGFFGWVLEIPAVGNVIAASVTTPSVAAAASAVTLSLAAVIAPVSAPDAIAFSPGDELEVRELEDLEVEDGTRTTTTSTPSSSGSVYSTATTAPYVIVPTTSSTIAPLPIPLPVTTTTAPVPTPVATRTAPTPTAPAVISAPTTTTQPRPTSTTTTTPTSTSTTSTSTTSTSTTSTSTSTSTSTTSTTAAPVAAPAVEGTGFTFVQGNEIPASLAPGAFVADQGIVFIEQEATVLSAPLETTLAGPDVELSAESVRVAIPEGTTICSYLYHFWPGKDATTEVVIEFPGEVLGHTTTATSLRDSDEFALPGVDYAWSRTAGILVEDYISVNGRTITLNLVVWNTNRDQVRVFTDCG